MKRYGTVIGLAPEKVEEYKRLHAEVWPDVLAMIRECNIRNYSIYLRTLDDGRPYLFSYFEYTGGDFSSHETARWAQRYRRQLTFVGRFYANAGLYDPPPAYSGQGRPRVKGDKRPTPAEVTRDAQR